MMKKQIKKIGLVFLIALSISFMNPQFSVNAASNTAAKKAFRAFLSQNTISYGYSGRIKNSNFSFRYYELGTKKVPILAVTVKGACHADGYVSIYQYVNGKVKRVISNDWIDKLYLKKGIVVVGHSGGGYGEEPLWYYKLSSKGVLKEFAYKAVLPEAYSQMRKYFGNDRYRINGKNVSKLKFTSYMKQKIKGDKNVKPTKFYSNSSTNRKKHIK